MYDCHFQATCNWDSTSSTPLLSPFQLPVSLPLQRFCLSKYPQGEAGQLFNTLHSTLYNLQKTVHPTLTQWLTIETGEMRRVESKSLTQLSSFLFPLTYPLFFLSLLCWLPVPYHSQLLVQVCLSLLGLFFLHCDSHPLIPPPLLLPLSVGKWHLSPSFIHSFQHTHLVYPNNTLNTPHPYILRLSLLTCSIESHTHLVQSRLSPAYTLSCTHTHTHKNTNTKMKLGSYLHQATVAVWHR